MSKDRPSESADLVLVGGTVVTMDGEGSIADAVAVRDGTIVYVGHSEEAQRHVGSGARIIDLAGKAVIPGINDSHLHATWLGAMWPHTLMGGDGPQGAGIRLQTRPERKAAIRRAGALLASMGITSYTEPGLGPGEDGGVTGCFGSDVLSAYAELANEGGLTSRVTVLNLFGELDGASSLEEYRRGLQEWPDYAGDNRWLRVAGVKIFADGIPPMRNAWTHHCYHDGSEGALLVDAVQPGGRAEAFRQMVLAAHEAGHQIGVHATGDRSIELFLDVVEEAALGGQSDLRHYVIHGDLVSARDLSRIKALGAGINMQPGIAVATAPILAEALTYDVAAAAWPLSSALSSGVRLCLSSDAPVLSPDWRQGIAAAARWIGTEADSGTALTEQLLRGYTTNPAWQDRADGWKGSLEVGKVADMCVLDSNPLDVIPSRLPEVSVEMTLVDGRIVYALRDGLS